MCGDLAIKPLPGKHMPPKQEAKFRVANPENTSIITNKAGSSGNTTYDSFNSLHSAVKHEIFDHSAFSANLNGTQDFPSLGGRKPRSNRGPLAKGLASRDARSVWNVPSSNCSVNDLEDAFDMPRR